MRFQRRSAGSSCILGGDGRIGPFDSRPHYESMRIDAAARALKEKTQ